MEGKILILAQGVTVAASRYRILQYVPYLTEHGLTCDVMDFPDTFAQYARLYAILPSYSCVFVQRKRFHFPLLALFRNRAGRIVFDLDDAVMYHNSLARSPYSRTRQRRFENMARASDVIIAGNSFLKEEALPVNSNTVIIPTSIPVERYPIKDYSRKKDRVTIGWIGDHGSIHYLERMKDVWNDIGRRFPGKVELKIVCDVFFDCEDIPVRKVQWSSHTEVEELQDMDIGIMPLIDDLWSRGKCGLKILQYFGVGIPAVCTPVGVNRDVVIDGRSGLWATSKKQWVDALSRLIGNDLLRQDMGRQGREILEKGYTMEVNAPKMLDLLKG